MTAQQISDIDGLKSRIKATWMAGDYGRVAELTAPAGVEFTARRSIKPGMKLLDVACGNGNLSIPAAKAGAAVVGIDIAPKRWWASTSHPTCSIKPAPARRRKN